MIIFEWLTWLFLAVCSVLALACLFGALEQVIFYRRRHQSAAQQAAEQCLSWLRHHARKCADDLDILNSHAKGHGEIISGEHEEIDFATADCETSANDPAREPQATVSRLLASLRKSISTYEESNGLAAVLGHLLKPNTVPDNVQFVIDAHLADVDRGGQGLCGYLAKVGPLLGLGGTLAGVRGSLGAFASENFDLMRFAAGFATALDTTLWGIFIAISVLFISRRIWVPLLDRIQHDLTKQAGEATYYLQVILK